MNLFLIAASGWLIHLNLEMQVNYLTFMCGSTSFGRLHAHHQELTTASAASGFTDGAWW